MTLDESNPIPLHIQLKKLLEKDIQQQKFKNKIPSERELMNKFSVSRSTVREAVTALVREGILEKKHGKGTFIALKPVQEWLGQLSGFEETVKNMGMKPSSKVLDYGIKSTPQNIEEQFHDKTCYLIERLRFADDQPVAIKRHYYPKHIGLHMGQYNLNSAVLYDLLQDTIGIQFWKSEQMITSRLPTSTDADHLKIPNQSSVLIKEQLISDMEGNLLEYSNSIFHAEMYAFYIKTTRSRDVL